MAHSKIKGLQMWCKSRVEGYRDVEIRDMASSWKSGLAFCAVIHRFRPDLIDYDSLDKENEFDNNDLAFRVAEKELGIPALLEAADMVAMKVPDRLCVITYVAQYHNYFRDQPMLGGPGISKHKPAIKRAGEEVKSPVQEKVPNVNKESVSQVARTGTLDNICNLCRKKVFLLERQIEGHLLYHRSCFRDSEMSPTNKIASLKRKPEQKFITDSSVEPKYCLSKEKDNKSNVSSDTTNKSLKKLDRDVGDTVISGGGGDKSLADNGEVKNVHVENSKPQPYRRINCGKSSEKPVPNQLRSDENMMCQSSVHSLKTTGSQSIDNTSAYPKPSAKPVLPKARPRSTVMTVPNSYGENSIVDRKNIKSSNESQDSEMKVSLLKTLANVRNRQITKDNISEGSIDSIKFNDNSGVNITPPISSRDNFKKNILKVDGKMSTQNRVSMEQPLIEGNGQPDKINSVNDVIQNQPRAKLRHVDDSYYKNHAHQESECNEPEWKLIAQKKIKKRENRTSNDMSESIHSKQSVISCENSIKSNKPVINTGLKPVINLNTRTGAVTTNVVSTANAVTRTNVISMVEAYTTANAITTPNAVTRTNVITMAKAFTTANVISTSNVIAKRNITAAKVVATENSDTTSIVTTPRVIGNSNAINKRAMNKMNVASQGNVISDSRGIISGGKYPSKPISMEPQPRRMPRVRDRMQEDKTDSNFTNDKIDGGRNVSNNVIDHTQGLRDNKELNDSDNAIAENSSLRKPNDSAVRCYKNNVIDTSPLKPGVCSRDRSSSTTTVLPSNCKPTMNVTYSLNQPSRLDKSSGVLTNQDNSNCHFQIEDKWTDNSEREVNITRPHIISASNKPRQLLRLYGDIAIANDSADVTNRTTEDLKLNGKLSQLDKNIATCGTALQHRPEININSDVMASSDFSMRNVSSSPTTHTTYSPNESLSRSAEVPSNQVKQAKTKRPAPGRPPRPRRSVGSHIDILEIQKKLAVIDKKLTSLEEKGRGLEDAIRQAGEDDDKLMVKWFSLVNEKNSLVRDESDLIYQAREVELENQQILIDAKLRHVLNKPNVHKTESDLMEEEKLLRNLLDIVEQRDRIISSIHDDKIRYEEEDAIISKMMKSKGLLTED